MSVIIKNRKCRCGNVFEPAYRNGILISRLCYECIAKKGKSINKTQKNKEKKQAKEKLKTKSDWLNDLQKVFNSFIRERDKDQTCISCGAPLKGKYDAGHFFSVGSHPNLRFNEDNVHGQCVYCNQHKHSNAIEYSVRLPDRIGKDRYDKLISERHIPLKLSIPEIKDMILIYKQKIKSIKNESNYY